MICTRGETEGRGREGRKKEGKERIRVPVPGSVSQCPCPMRRGSCRRLCAVRGRLLAGMRVGMGGYVCEAGEMEKGWGRREVGEEGREEGRGDGRTRTLWSGLAKRSPFVSVRVGVGDIVGELRSMWCGSFLT